MVRVLSSSVLFAAAALLASSASATDVASKGLKLYGVNYNIRSGADWEPEATKCKSAEVIDQELAKLKVFTDTIRLYSLTDCDQAAKVLPAAAKAGLKVTLGLWVAADAATFAAEKLKLQELLAQDGLVTAKNTPAIYVGSEAMYRNEVNVTTAIANAKEIKSLCATKQLNVPITIADTTEIYLKYPQLIDAVDFASPNVFPFWDKITADKAPAQLYGKLEKLIKIAKGKDIVIGETGWPTDGVEAKGSKASMANAQTYFQGFYDLAKKKGLKYYYFAGFDESWKLKSASANSTIEAFFGLFDKDGEIKQAYKALEPAAPVATSSSGSASVDAGVPTTSTLAPDTAAPSATPAPAATTAAPIVTPAPATKTPTVTSAPVVTSSAPSTTPAPAAAGSTGAATTSPTKEVVVGGEDSTDDDAYVPGGVSGAGKGDADSGSVKQTDGTSYIIIPAGSKGSSADKATAVTAAPATAASAAPATAASAAPATAASAAPATAASAAPATAASVATLVSGSSEDPATSGKKKRSDCDA